MREKLKNLSMFQIVSIVLIVILFVAIIIQLGMIINLKHKLDDTNRRNEELVSLLPNEEEETQSQFYISINYQP